MDLKISEIVSDLRLLYWDKTTNYITNELLLKMIDELANYHHHVKEEDIKSLNVCLELIQSAIENRDVVLLCDLLEFEFEPIYRKLMQ